MKVSGSGTPQFSLGAKRGAVGLQLQIDSDALQNLDKNLKGVREGLLKAYTEAVNKTNEQVGGETVRLLTQAVNAEQQDIADRVRVNKIKDGQFVSASVTILDKPKLSMRMFKPDQRRDGVHVRPLRRGNGFTIQGAFGPDIRRLGRGVYKRRTKKSLPIRKLAGLSLTKLVRRARVLPQLDVFARTTFKRNLSQSIVRYALGVR